MKSLRIRAVLKAAGYKNDKTFKSAYVRRKDGYVKGCSLPILKWQYKRNVKYYGQYLASYWLHEDIK